MAQGIKCPSKCKKNWVPPCNHITQGMDMGEALELVGQFSLISEPQVQ